ncbi:hypothetical protein J5Y03_01925 [Bacillus sp. RG28]|uniref:Helix-turn-helix domain-containing protein n=1 Tax=Gottfriedia endophytica TaxID=2820819 RepID=A0A940NM24_9BACI|nr:hypothetical protein [Gottfriedia endophytica]MBP0723938.1 hypothetical protein [Gottfriedia endophytica]
MEREYNLEEALKILMDCYITDSIQTLRKWIRDGKINAISTSYRQGGYKIMESDLVKFIQQERLGLLDMVRVYKTYVEKIPLSVATLFKDNAEKFENSTKENKEEITEAMKNETINSKSVKEIKGETKFPMELQEQEVSNAAILKTLIQFQQHVDEKFERLDKLEKGHETLIYKFEDYSNKYDFKYNELKNDIEKLKEELKTGKKQKDIKEKDSEDKKEDRQHLIKDSYSFKSYIKYYLKKNGMTLDENQREKFENEALKAYKLFYDDHENFLENKYYQSDQSDYVMKFDDKDAVLTGANRGELMVNYFNKVFFPELKQLFVEEELESEDQVIESVDQTTQPNLSKGKYQQTTLFSE